MKHIALLCGIATALVVSCSIEEKDFQTPGQENERFYATIEQPGEDGTRVYATEDLLLRWTADDRVSIFNKSTYNQQYKFTGETGDNAGGFRKVATDEFVTGNAISDVVSVYPYQEGTKISESEVITVTLPAEQHYAEKTFGLGANTMVSVTEDNFLQYKNVGGYLVLKLYGEGVSVSSITLKGNNGEKLAGKATVTMSLDGAPTLDLANDATDEITLLCDKPVSLNATAEESIEFWFVVPPLSFNKGFTISINQTSGGVFEKSTSKSITLERSNLSKMSPIDVSISQINNIIYYTSSDGKVVTPYSTGFFGANIVSNEYVDGMGIITFNKEVTSIGDYSFYQCLSLTSITIPESVSSIETHAFCGCSSLNSITLPDGLISIGDFSFMGCARLESITIPRGVISVGEQAFYYCTNLSSVVIPTNMASIGGMAFAQCTKLTSITIPESVASIGESAFMNCFSLSSITVLSRTPPLGSSSMFDNTNNCPIIVPAGSINEYKVAQFWSEYADRIRAISPPDNAIYYTSSDGMIVTPKDVFDASIVSNVYSDGIGIITFDRDLRTVGEAAFSNCQRLTSINLPVNLRGIGRSAFSNCTSLTSINTPKGLDSIGSFAFSHCSSLSSISIPESVTSIGDHAFSGCSSLSSITIPERVSSIMEEMFRGCTSLVSFKGKFASSDGLFLIDQGVLVATALGAMNGNIVIPNNVYRIGLCAFEGCTSLTSIIIPDSVTSIGKYAFYNCSSLSDITISNSVTSIAHFAFYGCLSLNNIAIPKTVTIIGDSAFYDCSSLTQVTIPTSVKSIGISAFERCGNLSSIVVLPLTPPSGAASMFEMITNNCPIYVPAESVDAYIITQYWSDYSSRIQAMPSSVSVPEAIDLGLPSGLKWASFNLGASKPEEYGDYYAWGETEPYYSSQDPLIWKQGKEAGYNWASYKFELGTDVGGPFSKYVLDSSFGTVDNKTVLDPEDDAAYVNWGKSWRMPTYEEWAELGENCTWTWTTQNNVKGRLVTGPNGNCIFLPAAGILDNTSLYIRGSGGYYWSSSVMQEKSYSARNIGFESDGVFWNHCNHPIRGFSVRPVAD